jgi:hypothetical protein
MIYQANDEIRAGVAESERRRQVQVSTRRPFAYLDWLLLQLEEFHVAGKKRVPRAFERYLFAAADLLIPVGVQPPLIWRTLIRHVIDQVFELQEQLLQLRDPERGRAIAHEDNREMPPVFLLPRQPENSSESDVA